MTSQKLFSVGLVSILVVLASVAGVAVTADPGASHDISSTSTADTGTALAQQDGSDTEPNDDRENATPISTGVEITGDAGTRENGTDVDWYAFDVSAGEAFNVNYGGITENVSVYGPSGERLDSEEVSTPDTFVVGAVADEAGTYYARVTGGMYSLDVQTSSPDPFEPNDDRESAASIEPGEGVNGALFEGEQDWYAVGATDGQTLSVVVERLSGFADPAQNVRIDLFASNGSPVGEGFVPGGGGLSSAPLNQTDVSGGGESRFQVGQRVTAGQNGTYYVRISPVEDLSGFVDYSLTTDVSGGDQSTATTEEPTTTAEEPPTEEPSTDELTTETETPQPTTDTADETSAQTTALANTITIRSTGSERVFYTITTSGRIQPSSGADLSSSGATSPDSVGGGMASGSTAEGGRDNFTFTGNITGITLQGGSATVMINGEQVNPASFADATSISTSTVTSQETPTATLTETTSTGVILGGTTNGNSGGESSGSGPGFSVFWALGAIVTFGALFLFRHRR